MMKCPKCLVGDSDVIDSRASIDKFEIRRRRVCKSCQERWTTYERVPAVPMKKPEVAALDTISDGWNVFAVSFDSKEDVSKEDVLRAVMGLTQA